MTWESGGPGSHIPEKSKRAVRKRQGNRCNTIDPKVCTKVVEEFDHIVNVKKLRIDRKHANDPALLQGLCRACHAKKTQAEAQEGRKKHLRKPPRHPGLKQADDETK